MLAAPLVFDNEVVSDPFERLGVSPLPNIVTEFQHCRVPEALTFVPVTPEEIIPLVCPQQNHPERLERVIQPRNWKQLRMIPTVPSSPYPYSILFPDGTVGYDGLRFSGNWLRAPLGIAGECIVAFTKWANESCNPRGTLPLNPFYPVDLRPWFLPDNKMEIPTPDCVQHLWNIYRGLVFPTPLETQ